METTWIVPVLSLVTLLAVAVLALWSKARTEARRHDPSAPTSTLARDGRFGGVAPVLEDGLAEKPSGAEARVGAGGGVRRVGDAAFAAARVMKAASPSIPQPHAPAAPTVPRT